MLRDDRGAVLLQRREAKGVWQGLWSLPEAADEASFEALRRRLGAGPGTPLPAFVHAFSHYRLAAQPHLHPPTDATPALEASCRWTLPDEFDAIGLPRPIRTLLESLP